MFCAQVQHLHNSCIVIQEKKWNYNKRRSSMDILSDQIQSYVYCLQTLPYTQKSVVVSGPRVVKNMVCCKLCSLIFMVQFWLQPAHVFTYKLWALGHMCMHISQFSYFSLEQLLCVFRCVHRPWQRDRLHPGKLPRWTRTATRIAMATSLLVSIATTYCRSGTSNSLSPKATSALWLPSQGQLQM